MNAATNQAMGLSEAELNDLGVKAFQGLRLTRQDAQDICRVRVQGAVPLGSTPQACGAYITSALERWSRVARQTGASLG